MDQYPVHWSGYDPLRGQLVEARLASGLSQRQLFWRLGMPPTYVSKADRGERRLDALKVVELLLAVGADPMPSLARLVEALTSAGNG